MRRTLSMPRTLHIVVNITLFQIGWLSCVLGAVNGMSLVGPIFVIVAVGLHLIVAPMPTREMQMLAGVSLLGLAWETLMIQTGFLAYNGGLIMNGLPPYWIIAMWFLFATTLNVSLRWLHGRKLLAAALGAIFGPATYYAGAVLGGVSFAYPTLTMTVVAISWALLMPTLASLAMRLDGFADAPEQLA